VAQRLIIFARYPEPGEVKTRLVSALGATGAAQLHSEMTAHTLHWAAGLRQQQGIDLEVRFSGGDELRMQAAFGSDARYLRQADGDLGQRLIAAIGDRPQRTVVIGTDCPDLTPQLVLDAFAALGEHDVVLGPATDGGYYLIGVRRPAPALFQGIAWGTTSVCSQTRQIAAEQGLSTALLSPLSDVDRPEDLAIWSRVRARCKEI